LFSIFVEQHWRDPNVLVVGNLSALCPGENRGFFYGLSQGYMLNIFLAMHIARFFLMPSTPTKTTHSAVAV
jgi:hypothetical protein